MKVKIKISFKDKKYLINKLPDEFVQLQNQIEEITNQKCQKPYDIYYLDEDKDKITIENQNSYVELLEYIRDENLKSFQLIIEQNQQQDKSQSQTQSQKQAQEEILEQIIELPISKSIDMEENQNIQIQKQSQTVEPQKIFQNNDSYQTPKPINQEKFIDFSSLSKNNNTEKTQKPQKSSKKYRTLKPSSSEGEQRKPSLQKYELPKESQIKEMQESGDLESIQPEISDYTCHVCNQDLQIRQYCSLCKGGGKIYNTKKVKIIEKYIEDQLLLLYPELQIIKQVQNNTTLKPENKNIMNLNNNYNSICSSVQKQEEDISSLLSKQKSQDLEIFSNSQQQTHQPNNTNKPLQVSKSEPIQVVIDNSLNKQQSNEDKFVQEITETPQNENQQKNNMQNFMLNHQNQNNGNNNLDDDLDDFDDLLQGCDKSIEDIPIEDIQEDQDALDQLFDDFPMTEEKPFEIQNTDQGNQQKQNVDIKQQNVIQNREELQQKINNMQKGLNYKAKITYEPQFLVAKSGQKYSPNFEIQNYGQYDWPKSTFLECTLGPDKAKTIEIGIVKIGQTVKVLQDMVAPLESKKYKYNWKIQYKLDENLGKEVENNIKAFGNRISYDLTVEENI